MVNEVALTVPRHAASPRRVARPAELWRLCQDAVVHASAQQGWPPERYAEIGGAFVLVRVAVRHHREVPVGAPLRARTWVRAIRRRTLCDREVRLLDMQDQPVLSATQRWAFVSTERMALQRAPAELLAAFSSPAAAGGAPPIQVPVLPAAAAGADRWTMALTCWQTWLDPLGHVNHPNYLEWCDEALMRRLAERGLPPADLQPVAEHVDFRQGVLGGARVVVHSAACGMSADGAVVAVRHRVTDLEGSVTYAEVETQRRLASGPPLGAVLSGTTAAS